MVLSKIDDIKLADHRIWYHELNRNSNILTITVGDSWTWGDALGMTSIKYDDYNYRTTHIYGHLLAEKINSDFINIGLPGQGNLYILHHLNKVLKNLSKSYQKIYVIFTLTEIGRDISNGFLNYKEQYHVWREGSWPTFEDFVNGNITKEQIEIILHKTAHTHFNHVIDLFTNIQSPTGLISLFERYEKSTFNILNNYFTNNPNTLDLPIHWIIGRNFTSTFESNKSIVGNHLLEERWVDIIAQRGNLDAYPNKVYLLSQMGISPLLNLTNSKFKDEWINVLKSASEAIAWLNNSPYNSKWATKHPLEQAHEWWAEHLYDRIK